MNIHSAFNNKYRLFGIIGIALAVIVGGSIYLAMPSSKPLATTKSLTTSQSQPQSKTSTTTKNSSTATINSSTSASTSSGSSTKKSSSSSSSNSGSSGSSGSGSNTGSGGSNPPSPPPTNNLAISGVTANNDSWPNEGVPYTFHASALVATRKELVMSAVKAVSVCLSRDGYLLIVDTTGRLWQAKSIQDTHNWVQLTLPEDPID